MDGRTESISCQFCPTVRPSVRPTLRAPTATRLLPPMRTRLWALVVAGWLPVWGLYTTLILTAHQGSSVHVAAMVAFKAVLCAALLGVPVAKLAARLAWPHPLRPGFVAIHVVAAAVYSFAWLVLMGLLDRAVGALPGPMHLAGASGPPAFAFIGTGMWFYVMVAGVSYATSAAERAARAEAVAARSQLAALRAQLNPHFLFNALHTVVQLIPREPRRASQAAEQLAGLLRSAIGEDRDLVTLREELAFVERYLEVERLRFADRLESRIEVPDELRDAVLPSFALLTLVENAVRHGVEPSVSPTAVTISATSVGDALRLEVRDTGAGGEPARAAEGAAGGTGTGLARLRERLAVLYGSRARLEVSLAPGAGCTAELLVPRNEP